MIITLFVLFKDMAVFPDLFHPGTASVHFPSNLPLVFQNICAKINHGQQTVVHIVHILLRVVYILPILCFFFLSFIRTSFVVIHGIVFRNFSLQSSLYNLQSKIN
jgi:hypothetical protein